jgi:hypothetical protein
MPENTPKLPLDSLFAYKWVEAVLTLLHCGISGKPLSKNWEFLTINILVVSS